jgi:hypothetical protein
MTNRLWSPGDSPGTVFLHIQAVLIKAFRKPLLGIRVRIRRIRMFLGLPDPLVRGIVTDLAQVPSPFLINVLSGLK